MIETNTSALCFFSKKKTLFVFSFSFIFFYPSFAHAYLDPGTGNVLVYLLVSFMGAIFFLFKDIAYRLLGKNKKNVFSSSSSAKGPAIVLFSEGKNYWLTFKPIIEALIEKQENFTYLSLDLHDPALTIESEYMHARYVGKGSSAFAKIGNYNAQVMLSTTPNIGAPNYPMPRPKHINCLAHVCHGIGDIALYHKYSLDAYDAVLMVGDFMLPSIRTLEKLRNIKEKECVALGLPYFDELAKSSRKKDMRSDPAVILIAPSWGEKSSLSLYGSSFIQEIAKAGYEVILRPHPFSFQAEEELISRIIEELAVYENISIDKEVNGSLSMQKADLMISDKSCVRFDFAFLYEKPVISLDIPLRSPEIYEYDDLGAIWEDTAALRLGPVLQVQDFGRITEFIEKALQTAPQEIQEFRDQVLANQGKSASMIADWAINKIKKN